LLRLQRNPIRGQVHSGIVIGEQEIPLVARVPVIDSSRPKEGLEIGISGYPLSESVLLTNSGHIASVWATDIADLHVPNAPEWFRLPDIVDRYLVDAEANPGNSGGPVYLVENASVIGICVATTPAPVRDQDGKPALIGGKTLFYSSGLTLVVPAQYIVELVKRQNADS